MNEYLPLEIAQISNDADIEQAFEVRRRVFVAEQNVDEDAEIDGLDEYAMHLLATVHGDAIGTLRIRFLNDGDIAKVERVAVLKDWRSSGVGSELMKEALNIAARFRTRTMKLHAQVDVVPFYENLGYTTEGEPFDEEGIPHLVMTLQVPATPNHTF